MFVNLDHKTKILLLNKLKENSKKHQIKKKLPKKAK
jgi:hypothetical protein